MTIQQRNIRDNLLVSDVTKKKKHKFQSQNFLKKYRNIRKGLRLVSYGEDSNSNSGATISDVVFIF